ncbi:MAG: peptidase S10 [Cereibacter sphaeroides]|uniref:Peptidase S10 n=1 Tax=Cereibacter sphaeroides TaxID=1063 RepID=A0A2W5RWQ2_CERSP|nr:MAG: peptidase S10 [Cereibacter sphaeroides]
MAGYHQPRPPRFGTMALLACLLVSAPPVSAAPMPDSKSAQAMDAPSEQKVESRHSITVNGRVIDYQATAGTLILKDQAGKPAARLFYTAYVADREKGAPERPLTFFYNGGPGSSSIWLHMASFGPVRVPVGVDRPAGAARSAPNSQTLLDVTDMIFLDAVGTGYSRTFDPADNKNFYGNDQDAAAFAQAIRRYVDLNGRWRAPKYLFGESYGTTRSAMLSYRLTDSGMPLDGVILMSSILNFAQRAPGLDRMAINSLPTYAATAWYHGRVDKGAGLEAHVEKARQFAQGPYAAALARGHHIAQEERDTIAAQLAAMTGLPASYIAQSDLYVPADRFRKELLRGEGRITGGFDTRFTGMEADRSAEAARGDPAEDAIAGSVITNFKAYLAQDLGYRGDMEYIVSSSDKLFPAWDWSHKPPVGPRQNALADVAVDLDAAMRRNPRMRVLSLNGYYDLSTPFFATEFDLAHMYLPKELLGNLVIRNYPSGHMLYLDDDTRSAVAQDVRQFLRKQ